MRRVVMRWLIRILGPCAATMEFWLVALGLLLVGSGVLGPLVHILERAR